MSREPHNSASFLEESHLRWEDVDSPDDWEDEADEPAAAETGATG